MLLKNFFLKRDDQERKQVDNFMSNITNMSPDSLLSQLGKISVDEGNDNDINSNGSQHHPEISLTGHEKSKPGLIEEISSSVVKLEVPKYEMCVREAEGSKPKRVVIKVSLPQVTSVKSCELDIMEVSQDAGIGGRISIDFINGRDQLWMFGDHMCIQYHTVRPGQNGQAPLSGHF